MIAMLLPLLQILPAQPAVEPLRDIYERAVSAYAGGRFEEAGECFEELTERMPGFERAPYDLAATLFMLGDYVRADSILSTLSGCAGPDTLESARAAALLAASVAGEDRAGVERAAGMLKDLLGDGEFPECDAHNLEAALNWLDDHPPQDQQDQEDQQDQQDQEEQQDQQDQEEQQDQQDSVNPETGMTEEQARLLLDLVQEASPSDSLRG
ncbi:MAG: hypothetical protein QUS11_02225 [Candidatus Fermentibacter sp.]|nr:hypothetical protein [Candidatus Fermentibacter sp.]